MRKTLLLVTLISLAPFTNAQTQAENNLNASDALKKAEQELTDVITQINLAYKSDLVFIESLKTSQANWEVFRDSEIRLKYPSREPGYYGSIHGMCLSIFKRELTKERTAKLQVWLDGIEEGDACAGTVRSRD